MILQIQPERIVRLVLLLEASGMPSYCTITW